MKSSEGRYHDADFQGLTQIALLSIGGICSLVIFAWPAARCLNPGFASEFLKHSRLLQEIEAQHMPIYSLWYILQKLIVGSDLSINVLTASGLLLIGAFALLKGVILTGLLSSAGYSALHSLAGGLMLGTSVALPLPFVERFSPFIQMKTQYLGTLPPNTFMSATQLVANVGVLPAFFALQMWGRLQNPRSYQIMLVACFIASLCKPGIAPALFAGIALCIALSCWNSKTVSMNQLWRILIAALVLLTPSLIISRFYLSGAGWMNIKAVIAPFATWSAYSSQIVPDFIASFSFPLTVIFSLAFQHKFVRPCNAASIQGELRGLLPCLITVATSVLIFAIFGEKVNGQFFYSGNFAWAAVSANSGIHLVCFIAMKKLRLNYKVMALLVLFLEALGGFAYLAGYVKTGIYA